MRTSTQGFRRVELARRRLIFEELFVSPAPWAKGRRRQKAYGFENRHGGVYSSLLYGRQRRAVADAVRDMCSGKPMNRLIQGMWGRKPLAAACTGLPGKTATRALSPHRNAADQHFKTSEFLALRPSVQLTGSMSANKRETRTPLPQHIGPGGGTHALLSDNIEFNQLA